jgi:hypothetical protein
MLDMIDVLKNSKEVNVMIKFKKFVNVLFYSKGTSFTVFPDGKDRFVLRGEGAYKEIATLIDNYVIEKLLITEELSRIDHTGIGFTPFEERYVLEEYKTVSVLFIKDERVKSLSNMQPIPKRLLEHLHDGVLKELKPTSKQVGMIRWLEEEVKSPELRRSIGEIMKMTKREASEVIKVLLDQKQWFDELVEKSKQANSSTTA